ncbi:hypothetical protein [uncultured Brachyspira sp.]|uniref:hypothetical protein n=2 Tax=uncultured Brachyspira sp. TaxID=221953 RepID=UPI0025E378DB|nr:hypothetical protein [uncultured Brachyspira sp.]
MKFFLILLLFSMISCITAPEIYLKTDNALYWKELIKNKASSDIYQNIYRFDKKGNMNLTIYGYKDKIKYTLFLMKQNNQAFYYKKYTLKNYIIESLPSLDLYKDVLEKSHYDIFYIDYFFSKKIPDKSIYLPIGFMVNEDILYIAKIYDSDYEDRLNHWLRKNGYGYSYGNEWIPAVNVDWSSYPVPTEHEIDWNRLELIGKLF